MWLDLGSRLGSVNRFGVSIQGAAKKWRPKVFRCFSATVRNFILKFYRFI